MSIDIKELSESDLKQKIKNIKTEREKTANALKRYEEELERREQEVPLGVPCNGNFCVNFNGTMCNFNDKHSVEETEYNIFNTLESAKKHREILLAWRKALVANAKGEPIDIQVLLPLLPKGWVWMGQNGIWGWSVAKPVLDEEYGRFEQKGMTRPLFAFNLKPVEDWRNSLMECGL